MVTRDKLIKTMYDLANAYKDPEVQVRVATSYRWTQHPIESVTMENGELVINLLSNHIAASPKDDVHKLLHKLWGKAIGTSDYNKDEWMAFQRLLE